VLRNKSNTKDRVSPHFQTPRRELTNFEVFGNVVKHCLECLIYLLNRNLNYGEKGEIKS